MSHRVRSLALATAMVTLPGCGEAVSSVEAWLSVDCARPTVAAATGFLAVGETKIVISDGHDSAFTRSFFGKYGPEPQAYEAGEPIIAVDNATLYAGVPNQKGGWQDPVDAATLVCNDITAAEVTKIEGLPGGPANE